MGTSELLSRGFLRIIYIMLCGREWSLSKMGILKKLFFILGHLQPSICSSCWRIWDLGLILLKRWSECTFRGICSLISLGFTALFVVLWSFFLSLSSALFLFYALLVLLASCATTCYLGQTSGLLLIGFLGVLAHWAYGNTWMIAGLLIIGGYLFCQSKARILIFISTAYSLYSVFVSVGWSGIILLTNLSFLSNDLLSMFLQECDHAHENGQREEPQKSTPDDISPKDGFCSPESEAMKVDSGIISEELDGGNTKDTEKHATLSDEKKSDSRSLDEIRRIMDSSSHYEALGFPRYKNIDSTALKKEYKRMAVLVHPDKNIGNPLASESFKRLQSAYAVLCDVTKRRIYDERLRKEELSIVLHKNHGSSNRTGAVNGGEKSRRIKCTLCSRIHLWILTNRSIGRARWCQDCSQYHPARDGEGWLEKGPTRPTSGTKKAETPRAFVCAEDKIFDITEWASCQMQGVPCKINGHQATFRAKIVGPDPRAPSSDESPCKSDALMTTMAMMEMEKKGEVFWLKQAFSSGRLSDAHHLKKTWTPFKIPPKNSFVRQLRRYSLG